MAFDSKVGFKGIVTACGEVGVDAGALKVADNVTLRKAGVLSSRPTFTSTALTRAYQAAFPYQGDLYYIAAGNALYYSGIASQAAAARFTFGSYVPYFPTALRGDVQSMKEARGGLYLAAAEGVYKVVSSLYGTFGFQLHLAGGKPTDATISYYTTLVTGSSELLNNNEQVGYRAVMVRKDIYGIITRSRPSGAVTILNTSGAAATPQLTIYPVWLSTSLYPEQKIELYRTRIFPSSVAIDDEMQLVATFVNGAMTTSSVLISTNPITYNDKVTDVSRTTTLYTSPSRGGIENANDRPPGAACLERFRGSLFFGNITSPQRIIFSYKPGGNVTGQATGIGVRTATGSNAAGASTITSVSNTTGVRVGQIVGTQTSGYAAVSGEARSSLVRTVTAVAGTTVTVSLPLPNAQTTNLVYFWDAISVDAYTYPLGSGSTGLSSGQPYQTTSGALSNSGPRDFYTAYEQTPPIGGYAATVVLEAVNRGGAAVQVKSSRGDEMSPAIPLSTAGTGALTTNDVLPNGLMWSEPDEPEHVPPKNFARVGDTGKAILALVATKDRLLIFKEDGIFYLTGDTAKNFSISPLDTTALCILPGSVKRLQNTVYALTNLGLIMVDESGTVQIVSRPIQNEIAVIVLAIRQAQQTTGLYNMPGLSGITGAADDANGEYWLALGSTTPSFGGQILVYNAFAGGFTTYTHAGVTPVALSSDATGLPLTLTSSSLLSAGYVYGPVLARIAPHAFSDPALVGKFWTHIVAGMSWISGVGSVTATFSSSESMRITGQGLLTETLDIPVNEVSVINLPSGSLLRHPVPNAFRRGFLLFVELAVNVTAVNGYFALDFLAAEDRENVPNKRSPHNLTGA